jgi:hypothetical protein
MYASCELTRVLILPSTPHWWRSMMSATPSGRETGGSRSEWGEGCKEGGQAIPSSSAWVNSCMQACSHGPLPHHIHTLHYITFHFMDPKLVKMTVRCGVSHASAKHIYRSIPYYMHIHININEILSTNTITQTFRRVKQFQTWEIHQLSRMSVYLSIFSALL